MTRRTFIILIFILTIINTIAVVYLIMEERQILNYHQHETNYEHMVMPSDVPFPESFSFAGENVPINRIDVHESFRRELITNTYLHSSTIQILKNAPRYFSVIEPILKKEGVPDDFKYLAVIESNLNPNAISSAGAAGIWQFLKGTAKEYNLEVTDDVDERYHLEKSTRAACQYLKKGYARFGSWTLTAAAYNAGMGGINNQLNNQKEKTYYDLLLNNETARYVFRIFALKEIMENPGLYNFYVDETYEIEETENVKVTQSIKSLVDWAQKQGINYKTLKRFNPWLRKTSLNVGKNKTYYIAVPKNKDRYRGL